MKAIATRKDVVSAFSMILLLISVLLIIQGCKKNEQDNEDTWNEEDWTIYRSILPLQAQAGLKWEEWIVTMDTADAQEALKGFFMENPYVKDVQITEVGLSVMYTNGIVGGILLNPKRKEVRSQGHNAAGIYAAPSGKQSGFVSKNHKALLISPYYWDKEAMSSDSIFEYYDQLFPKVDLEWESYYKQEEVTVDLFTKLSGYRLIHIDTHGEKHKFWTNTTPSTFIKIESYMMTGESVNDLTTSKYQKDIESGNIGIWLMPGPSGIKQNVYTLTGNFVMDHNDFSRDTVLIIGGFCYSLAELEVAPDPKPTSSWSLLPSKCASGVFVGFTFPVRNLWFQQRVFSLMDSLCDTTKPTPCNVKRWFQTSVDDKCIEMEMNLMCMRYYGDTAFSLWLKRTRVETQMISEITRTTAKGGGNITSDGGTPIISRGVCWNTSGQPTTADNKTTDGSGTGSYISEITDLLPKNKYFVRAYASNDKGKTIYGNQVVFTTLGDSVSVVTAPVTEITKTTAVSGGTIEAESGTSIKARGLSYGTSPEPTLAGPSTWAGSGTGTFSSMMGSLTENTKYYVRAYATDQDDSTYYGNQVVFTTAASSYYIGQQFGGGVIFYIDSTGQHGLISDKYDLQNAPWGCSGNLVGGTSASIGSGQANSFAILASCGEANIAVRLCDNLVRSEYDDWYLPSLDELHEMYTQNMHIGGFYPSNYSSSTEYDAEKNWGWVFLGVWPVQLTKSNPNNIRCIRSF